MGLSNVDTIKEEAFELPLFLCVGQTRMLGRHMSVQAEILGIVNITRDSFSDGGRFLDPARALAHCAKLLGEGAQVLDLGPASSNPDAEEVSAEDEVGRLAPVFDGLDKLEVYDRSDFQVSVDSFQTETQRYALSRGVDYLNDIQGFSEPAFYTELAASTAKLIVMHSVQASGIATRDEVGVADMISHICAFYDDRLAALEGAGIARDRLILDPGMGFFLSPDPDVSFEVLARIDEIKARYQLPVLISVSRKSFLRSATGKTAAQAGAASLAAELMAVMGGADFIRTHEPAPLRDGLAVWQALSARAQEPPVSTEL